MWDGILCVLKLRDDMGAVSRYFGVVVLSLETNKYDFPTTKCGEQRAAKVLQWASTVVL